MAGQISPEVRRFPWLSPPGGPLRIGGMTADEVKLGQGLAARPDVQPIAQRAPVEFLTPSTSSDHLRLAIPTAANPFATPTGPKHDHFLVRTVLAERANSDRSRALYHELQDPPGTVSKESVGQMRASLKREHAMHGMLQLIQEMQEAIYSRIIGGQVA